jgi:mono/diheme cytochrome c family protein
MSCTLTEFFKGPHTAFEVFTLVVSASFFFTCCAFAQNDVSANQKQSPSAYVPSGERMYKEFCAACHGSDGRGHGPAASSLKVTPPDLTALAKRHKGKFPYNYVSNILYFGPGVSAHGSSAMPTWGPLFQRLDEHSEGPIRYDSAITVRDRVRNLSDYLASLQKK